MKVDIYKNLHKDCYSIRSRTTGRVIEHTDSAYIRDAKFVVQPAGRKKVLEERRKNVHAFVRGTLVTENQVLDVKDGFFLITPYLVKYNPYQADHFFYDNPDNRIDEADLVVLDSEGVTAWKQGEEVEV